jgi:NitT/TauT family transport system substrate-binding protein
MKDAVVAAAFKNMTFTNDPIASSLYTSAKHAEDVGLLKPVDLKGIYDLGPLNALLKADGQPEVSDAAAAS